MRFLIVLSLVGLLFTGCSRQNHYHVVCVANFSIIPYVNTSNGPVFNVNDYEGKTYITFMDRHDKRIALDTSKFQCQIGD